MGTKSEAAKIGGQLMSRDICESKRPNGVPVPSEWEGELNEVRETVFRFTKEMFPGPVAQLEGEDPEIAGRVSIVLGVKARGSINDVVALNEQWHRRLRAAAGSHSRKFCLSLEMDE